jgi:hypothetical protein
MTVFAKRAGKMDEALEGGLEVPEQATDPLTLDSYDLKVSETTIVAESDAQVEVLFYSSQVVLLQLFLRSFTG